MKRAPKKCFPEMLTTGGGGGGDFHVLHVFDQNFYKKTWKYPNKKGTFDVNLVFTATLASTKRALLSQKRALLVLWKNWGGGGGGSTCPPFLRP